MKNLKRLLARTGLLFILQPNITTNPCFLTLGGQLLHFSKNNLINLIQYSGFSYKIVTNHPHFPRSMLAECRHTKESSKLKQPLDTSFQESIEWLSKSGTVLKNIHEKFLRDTTIQKICIFGASQNAAWAFNLLKKGIDSFVDENPARIGSSFYGKEVIYPRELGKKDLVILPNGPTSQTIFNRLTELYKSQIRSI